MTDKLPFLAATDKDIFDLLMSSKGRMSEGVLRGIALTRGIIYSPKTDRERLASDISILPHDFASLTKLIERREYQNRNEKRAYVDVLVSLTHDEISEVVRSYKEEFAGEDELTTQQRRLREVQLNVAYDEIDYSKTRLIQRQRRDANIEFILESDRTTIRMPATEKARGVVDRLIKKISQLKLQSLTPKDLSLDGLTADQRTTFFMSMLRNIPGYQLQTVVSIKCASGDDDVGEDLEMDIEEKERAVESEIVGKINSVALSGMNLLQSEEYQSLKKNGFFITAVTWRALQTERPNDLMQFDVSFDEPRQGKGFKFGVRIARRLTDGTPTSDFKPLDPNRQPALWSLVERTSANALDEIIASGAPVQEPAERVTAA
ncbi:hypothetical protein EN962_00320 [Mesorhizobium sp. M7A.F.Ca.CA.001.09.2.1]|uniref:Uncharacterized protein n=1 Tax=Mesorhizobium ciceri TaxID=39645 RepID=A0AB38TA75_9HYPH|nr:MULTISPECIES: hypothetical protein [Mesorhizobium]RUY59337.1 hypothetical protein EN981_01240 [Mesorhizobium sp. M7A.F.Ca.CA.001.13.2.1]MDF3214820.1 hypothetical protein [Mesorhizobium ciceri]RUY73025.1 hypothetical protein EN980_01525 [Mesorhizobium sp. M7A.F.Ca.CA.001.13.1.1]RUY74477.1 hypothetical protein EN965_00980 [Mesorhizobium sp. M7A.F.Ca.CA.001.05.1.1]RUY81948.1 hypothetical protein EN962_00320 [Mesorhizobium sp. M7A.F.Ca.CA.001.09.2.1]